MTPNDGLCHLNRTGYYTYSTVQDYPSIGHVNHIAKQNSVSIIWAVTKDKFGLYEGLSELVAGSRAGKLSKDSSNIVELVKQQYEKITTSINVKSNHSTNCDVKIKAKCRSVNICTVFVLLNQFFFLRKLFAEIRYANFVLFQLK